MIEFSAVQRGERKLADLATGLQVQDLINATDQQIDFFVESIRDLSDAQIMFVATDPTDAESVGWNVAHVIAHLTASSEENVAISSILARGISYPYEPRLRSEVEWTSLTTTAGCLQRLEESRRIQLSYLNAWPDAPRLDTQRTLPEAFAAHIGVINAIGAVLLGLMHGDGHRAQVQEIIAQVTT